MSFCLPKFAADTFKSKIVDGTIDPQKLTEMSSEERRALFKEIVGDTNAKQVNALFESKLLLKNQQQGIINWAKSLTGLKPEVQRSILAKVEKMTEVLQPKDQRAFLEDLVEKRLGMQVTLEEASKIAELAKKIETTKSSSDRLSSGRAQVEFGKYVSDLKNQAEKTSIMEKIKTPSEYGKVVSEAGGFAKSLKASLDDSAIFRQGWKTMFTHPMTWLKNAKQSFVDLAQQFGGKEVLDEVQADILSRKNYDLMKKAKLAIGTTEEAFPSHLAEKVPLLGRAYKASEAAYTGFVYRMRADVFDKYLEVAKKAGIDVTDKAELESIGKLVNSLTGRGNLGKFETAASGVNNIFFSPRFLKSNIDTLTAHQFQKGVTPFVRKQAAINLVKIIGGTATILAIANSIKPGSVETDPRSSDFGKIKIGDTRFDVSGGMASVVTLASRLLTQSTKTNGTLKKLDTGKFGAPTSEDVLVQFAEGKFAPLISVLNDFRKGKDFNGNKATVLNEAKNLLVPLPITNYQELKNNPNSAGVLAGTIADALGIGTNTYSSKKK